jgi:hypothetical protein
MCGLTGVHIIDRTLVGPASPKRAGVIHSPPKKVNKMLSNMLCHITGEAN